MLGNRSHLPTSLLLQIGNGSISLVSTRGHAVELSFMTRQPESPHGGRDVVHNLRRSSWGVRKVAGSSSVSTANAVPSCSSWKSASRKIWSKGRSKWCPSSQTADCCADYRLGKCCTAIFDSVERASAQISTNSCIDCAVSRIPSSLVLAK